MSEIRQVLGSVARTYRKDCENVGVGKLCKPVSHFGTVEKCMLCEKTK